jgi:hypothetical protein
MESHRRRARASDRWRRRAERANEAYGLVLLLLLVTYVLSSVLANRGWPAVLTAISTSATAIVALTASHSQPVTVRRALLIALLAVALAVISAASGSRQWLTAASLLEIGLLSAGMVAVLGRVAVAATVNFRTILGAISVYGSLGILFTWAYGAIDKVEGGGFFAGVASAKGSDFIFFSYTTLTTTGYGNLVPASQFGRMVAGLEMMTGQVFLVTLVAGLVALWRPGQSFLSRRAETAGDE